MKNWKEIAEGISTGFSLISNVRTCKPSAKEVKRPTAPSARANLTDSVKGYSALQWLGVLILLMMVVRSLSITIQAGDITINNIQETRTVEPSAIDNQ